MKRWAVDERVIEYRRPHDKLTEKRRHPAATGYIHELYANESKVDPVERQALEAVFMQKVDGRAADALAFLEAHGNKPGDPLLRDAWSRFLMSLMHRSPERVRQITEKVQDYEQAELNPKLEEQYAALHGSDDPPTFKDFLALQGSLTPDLRVRLLRLMIDNQRIGNTLNAMTWDVHMIKTSHFSLLTGDIPIMLSNGLGHDRSFVMLAISPSKMFLAAHDPRIIKSFTRQSPGVLARGHNDACTRQSQHVIIAQSDKQREFIDERFLRQTLTGGNLGYVAWDAPLKDR